MKLLSLIILSTGVLFAFLNYYAFNELTIKNTRWIRLLGTIAFTTIAVFNRSSRKILGVLILCFLILSDFALIEYESEGAKILQFLMRGISYLMIGIYVIPILKNVKFNLLEKITLLIVFGINLYLLNEVADTFQDEVQNSLITIFFFFQGISGIMMLLAASVFLTKKGDGVALTYFLTSFGFILTDLAAFSAYHLEYLELFIVNRLFYLLAVGSLVAFLSIEKSSQNLNLGEL